MPPLPPIGDPRRPLHLAIRSMRLLGLIFVLLGAIMAAFAWAGTVQPHSWLLPLVVAGYLVPGVLYILFEIFLTRRYPWAVVGGIVVAILQLPFALFSLVMAILHGAHYLPLTLAALWVAGLIQLIYHLSKSFAAIRYEAIGGARGFDTLPPQAPTPPPPPLPLPGQRA